MKTNDRMRGFTLIEMLLVLTIISMVIYLGIGYIQQKSTSMRIDRASIQMQQILNAGLTYYIANGKWPDLSSTGYQLTGTNDLQPNYFPSGTVANPFGGGNYYVMQGQGTTSGSITTPPPYLYVITRIPGSASSGTAVAIANTLAGRLPLAYTSTTAPTGAGVPPPNDNSCVGGTTNPSECYVVSMVNIPGQNLNNASAVNYAGVYHNGGCVPVPTCPVDADGNTMTPQIMVVPVAVSGSNDSQSTNVYPISSFTAYAMVTTDGAGNAAPNATPPACSTGSDTNCYSGVSGSTGTVITTGKYWRVCLQVVTERGTVSWQTGSAATMTQPYSNVTTANNWGATATLMAITRCAITNEPSGSSFEVYSQ